jgi:hypothetical protein
MQFKIKRAKPKCQQLADKFGGVWTYDGMASWWCDDDIRHVSRVATGFDDECESWYPPEYIMYGDPSRNGSYRIRFSSDGVLV